MSQNIARAYKEFLKQEKKRKGNLTKEMRSGSTGLLARRKVLPNKEADDIDNIIKYVDEIRKYGGLKND